jgi:site-specific DNA-methyltransferase (adenine-specific)
MTPYFQSGNLTIYHGNCRQVMAAINGPFGAIVTDPPYGDTSLKWDKQVRGWMDPAEGFTDSLWCFGSLRFFLEMARTGESSRWKLAQEIVWEKQNGSGFHADRFKRVHELAVQFYRGEWGEIYKKPVTTPDATARAVRRKRRPPHTGHIEASAYVSVDGGPRLMRSVIREPNCHGYAIHPTQKPVGIIRPLLEYSVPPGGSVLDPFMGSGSTLVAAWELGLKGVGIEINESACEAAARRIEAL